LFGLFKTKSKDVAKKRLQVILTYERSGIPPKIVNEIKRDLMNVFSKYPYFDAEKIDVDIRRESETEELRISIPLKD